MKINFNTYNPYSSMNFGSCSREYRNNGNPVYTSTYFFRDDIEWYDLVKFVENNFKNKDKVNVYSLACSDGSEPYTFAMTVLDNIPQKEQPKYLPVYASDIDEEVIKAAQSGKINIDDLDLDTLWNYTERKFFDYNGEGIKIPNDQMQPERIKSYTPKPELAQSVKFERADILEKINSIKDDGNTVVLCRNVFPYLTRGYAKEVAKAAGNRLKKGSLFVIGEFDRTTEIESELRRAGFEKKLPYVFRKKVDKKYSI